MLIARHNASIMSSAKLTAFYNEISDNMGRGETPQWSIPMAWLPIDPTLELEEHHAQRTVTCRRQNMFDSPIRKNGD